MAILAETDEELLTESGEVMLLESDVDVAVTPLSGVSGGLALGNRRRSGSSSWPRAGPPRRRLKSADPFALPALTGGISEGHSTAVARIVGVGLIGGMTQGHSEATAKIVGVAIGGGSAAGSSAASGLAVGIMTDGEDEELAMLLAII